jgi:hypothetical protein
MTGTGPNVGGPAPPLLEAPAAPLAAPPPALATLLALPCSVVGLERVSPPQPSRATHSTIPTNLVLITLKALSDFIVYPAMPDPSST